MRWLIILPLALALLVAVLLGLGTGNVTHAHNGPHGTLSFDHDATDNTATAVGSIQECKSITAGQQFTVDLVVQGIPGNGEDMGAFQARITFNPSIVAFEGVVFISSPAPGPQFFLEKSGASISPLTSETAAGDWTIGGFQFGTDLGNNGDGVLASLAFRAVGNGLTNIELQGTADTFYADVSLTNHEFGSVNSGAVAINQACATAQPTATPPAQPAATPTAQPTAAATAGPVDSAPVEGTTPVTPFPIDVVEPVNRYSTPSTQGGDEIIVGTLAPGETATVVASVQGEAVDAGNDVWYLLEDGSFIYSGERGVELDEDAPGDDSAADSTLIETVDNSDGGIAWLTILAGSAGGVLALAILALLAWRLRNRVTYPKRHS